MEEKARNDIDVLIGEHYVPSELERKKSLMMYVIRWILLSLSQGKASRYEQFHLKQSLWRWTMAFLLLIPALVLSFVPYIRVLPLLAYVGLLAIRVIFFLQAWNGRYTSFDKERPFLPVFIGFGEWVLSIFDMELSPDGRQSNEDQQTTPGTVTSTPTPENNNTTTINTPTSENNDTTTPQQ